MGKSTVLASSIAIAAGQQAGSLQAENHPPLTWTDHGETKNGMVVIDANWRWTHKTGETTNCYTDNEWDAQLCPDKETCTQNCVVEGADAEYEATYGVHTSGSELQLDFVTEGEYSTNIGSRTFLMDDDYAYKLFQLKNKEFTYTVDDSNLIVASMAPCTLCRWMPTAENRSTATPALSWVLDTVRPTWRAGFRATPTRTQEPASTEAAALRLTSGRPTRWPLPTPCTPAPPASRLAARVLIAATTVRTASAACATRTVVTSSLTGWAPTISSAQAPTSRLTAPSLSR